MTTRIGRSFFQRDPVTVARALIGTDLLVDGVGGTIVEAEAYDDEDPASHSFRGKTVRNALLFGPAGHLYIYRIYGLHLCLNIVCGATGEGSAVLIRALEPRYGIERMVARRTTPKVEDLCRGPGRLSQALGLTPNMNGLVIDAPSIEIRTAAAILETDAGPRIGISRATEKPWRFVARGSQYVSAAGRQR